MKYPADHTAGAKPARATRRWTILAAGLVALCLQVIAQILPPDVMQSAMRGAESAYAGVSDEAQSFAGTCLGFGTRNDGQNDGQPAKPGNHASCPICFSLAQTQGFAPAPVDLSVATAWAPLTLTGKAATLLARSQAAAAFASRAPPSSLG